MVNAGRAGRCGPERQNPAEYLNLSLADCDTSVEHTCWEMPRLGALCSVAPPAKTGGVAFWPLDGHRRNYRVSSSAFNLCGVIGNCVTAPGMPMASSIAEAIAAPTGLAPPSPAPLRPSGLSGLGASSVTMIFSGRHLARRRHQVIGKRHRQRLAGLIIEEFLKQRAADALRHAAGDLAFNQHRIDGAADVVGDRHSARWPCRRCRHRRAPRRCARRKGRPCASTRTCPRR